jgi:hypothetical protein
VLIFFLILTFGTSVILIIKHCQRKKVPTYVTYEEKAVQKDIKLSKRKEHLQLDDNINEAEVESCEPRKVDNIPEPPQPNSNNNR